MRTPTDPLREEHREIRPRLTSMRALADRIEEVPADALADELVRLVRFLETRLIPHAVIEDDVLYPVVAAMIGAADSTATMSRDHLEIARQVEQLRHLTARLRAQPSRRLRRDLRRVLYRLEAILGLHLDKEEEIYLPLLDAHLTMDEADELFARMHAGSPRSRRVS